MPNYNDLRPEDDLKKKGFALIFPDMKDDTKKRVIQNLLILRDGLRKEVAVKKAENNLLVASWNIKEFGHTTQRLEEAYFYIAEIISIFDLVAIQEIKSTLKDLDIIMRLLGEDWGYIINDITEGVEGNSERSAYLFNRRRVELAGLAGEIVLWDELTRHSVVKQLKRTPYIIGFKSGWKTFAMVNLHLHPGSSPEDITYRRAEVDLLLQALHEKVSKGRLWNENLILVGDFNLYKGDNKDSPTIQIINQAGFNEVESLVGKDTNASLTESYDRFFLTSNKYFTLARNDLGKENGGVFNPFKYVFQDNNADLYKSFMKVHYTGNKDLDIPENLRRYYLNPWRKNQLSDHFPIWFELIIDSSDEFLTEKLGNYL
jgi:endonuclease/exonuclease/phosphatase family metal-dependent hydrolase